MITADPDFLATYLTCWTTPDPEERSALVDRLWAPDGTLSTSSPALTLRGREEICAHIARVQQDLVAGKGLQFRYDQQATSGDVDLLRWSMLAPNGAAVGRGVDVVTANAAGQMSAVAMFMGID